MTDDYHTPERDEARAAAARNRERDALRDVVHTLYGYRDDNAYDELRRAGYEVIATERRRALEELPGAYDTLRFCDQMEERE